MLKKVLKLLFLGGKKKRAKAKLKKKKARKRKFLWSLTKLLTLAGLTAVAYFKRDDIRGAIKAKL